MHKTIWITCIIIAIAAQLSLMWGFFIWDSPAVNFSIASVAFGLFCVFCSPDEPEEEAK